MWKEGGRLSTTLEDGVPRGTSCGSTLEVGGAGALFHVKQKVAHHRGAPPAVEYATSSLSLAPEGGTSTGLVANTTAVPRADRRCGALASHSCGPNVAREVATVKAEPGISSTLARTTVRAPHLQALAAALRKAMRLARGSTSVTRQSGLRIEKGIAGNPPPEPMSTRFASCGHSLASARLSGR